MKELATITRLASEISKNRMNGLTKQSRTLLGGQLESFIQYKGYGHKLTKFLIEACKLIPGASVYKDPVSKRVYVLC